MDGLMVDFYGVKDDEDSILLKVWQGYQGEIPSTWALNKNKIPKLIEQLSKLQKDRRK